MRELLDQELDLVSGGNDDGPVERPKKRPGGRWGWIVFAGELIWGWISSGDDEKKEDDEQKEK
ncbi:hypothetical protein [Kangiella geojedonensis]|uniref:Uncharacterized protein n=1 Tax=Kangiella geojedonensis TaxID=914150 RepID=A0A0F6RD32_9GAMM|nr:hypothetical protein [Kangiella geojedonensis]AKE52933.1 hypothetical protein TQ33_2002 [Kangiella geojedonensis]